MTGGAAAGRGGDRIDRLASKGMGQIVNELKLVCVFHWDDIHWAAPKASKGWFCKRANLVLHLQPLHHLRAQFSCFRLAHATIPTSEQIFAWKILGHTWGCTILNSM